MEPPPPGMEPVILPAPPGTEPVKLPGMGGRSTSLSSVCPGRPVQAAATRGPFGDMVPPPPGTEVVELRGMAGRSTSISPNCRIEDDSWSMRAVQTGYSGMFRAPQPPWNLVDNRQQIYGCYPHQFPIIPIYPPRPEMLHIYSDQYEEEDLERRSWPHGGNWSKNNRGKRDERSKKHDRKDYRQKSRSPERRRRSQGKCRRSPERRRRSPERQRRSSSKQDEGRNSRRDRSPVRDSITSAVQTKELRTKATLQSEYKSFMEGISKNLSTKSKSSESFSTSESNFMDVVPSLGSRLMGTLSKKSEKRDSKFGEAYCEMPPPKVYAPKLLSTKERNRGRVKTQESKPPKEAKTRTRLNKESPESDDDEDFVSTGPRPLMKKKPPKRCSIGLFLKKPSNINEENRPNLSQYGTASVQSHYENERVRMLKALTSEKTPKEVKGNIQDPRKPIMGPNISDFIADFIQTVGKSKRGVQIVAKKYHLPGNCIGLIPPKMTHDVWDILKKPTQMRDETLQNVQRWLSVGIIPVIQQIDLLGAGEQEAKDVCRVTSHSLTVLGFVLLNMSIKRRLLMRNSLHKKYERLCRTSNNVTDLLFGDNLAKDLIEIKFGTYEIEKSSEEDNDDMLSPNYKPTFFAGLAVPGADVDVNVASMINMACANEGDVEDLREKYKIPSNCEILIPAKINPEMWSLLSHSGLDLDYKLQDVQLSIGESTVPLMWLLQSVRENSYDPCRALEMLTDALALLGNAVYQMNKVRMEAMLKTLPETVHDFGRWYWPGAEQLSGDNLEEELQVCEDDNSEKRAKSPVSYLWRY